MLIPAALASFTIAKEAAKEALAKVFDKYEPIVAKVIRGAGYFDETKLLFAIGTDLNRAIQGGAGRGAKTWEWLDGRTLSAGLTTPWKREMAHAAVLSLFGDKTAQYHWDKAMELKAAPPVSGPPPKPESSGGAGLVVALGAAALLAVNALSGVRNPSRRRGRRRREAA